MRPPHTRRSSPHRLMSRPTRPPRIAAWTRPTTTKTTPIAPAPPVLVREAVLGEKGVGGLESGQGKGSHEGHEVEEGERTAQRTAEGLEPRDAGRHRPGRGFGERAPAQPQGRDRQARAHEKRQRQAVVAQHPSYPWADGEAEPHGGSHETHSAAPLFLGSRIADVRHRRRQGRRAEDTAEDPGQEELPHFMGEAEDDKGHGIAHEPYGKDGLATDAVAEPPPHGGKQELHEGVARGQKPDLEGRGPDVTRVELEHGQDDPEPHHDEKDRQPQNRKPSIAHTATHAQPSRSNAFHYP